MKNALLIGCMMTSFIFASSGENIIRTNSKVAGQAVELKVITGKGYETEKKMGIISLKITPQIIVWLEDTKGNLLETLFVTKKYGKQQWQMQKYDPNKTFRAEAFPFWLNKALASKKELPTKNKPYPDAVTGATPKASFTLQSKFAKSNEPVVICLELNSAFDTNEAYKAQKQFDAIDINGQPSLVYKATLTPDSKGKEVKLELAGHGGNTADDGKLYTDLSGITTAKDMVSSIIAILQ